MTAATGTARGSASRSGNRVGTVLDLVPLGLAVIAEAAWISVAGGLLAEFTLQQPVLGIPALAGFVVAGIVAAHHGRVSAANAPGGGARFVVSLPLAG